MRIFLLTISFFFIRVVNGQTNDECKYFQVITFIKTNEGFNNQLRKFVALDKKSKKEKFIEMSILPWVQFIEFRQFKDKIAADSVGLSKEVISDERLYFKSYNFEPFKSSFLENAAAKTTTKLYLTFSKVISNTLLVELLDFDNDPNIVRRLGSGVKILFIFDQFGFIKSTLFARITYN